MWCTLSHLTRTVVLLTGWRFVVSIDGMRLAIRSGSPATEACDALIVLAAEDKRLSGPAAAVDAAANGALAAVLALGDFDSLNAATG